MKPPTYADSRTAAENWLTLTFVVVLGRIGGESGPKRHWMSVAASQAAVARDA